MQGRDARIARIGDRQFGVFTRDQALAAGFPDSTIRRRLRSGAWDAIHPRVYHATGSPLPWKGTTAAAWLACGGPAVISRRSAAALWELGIDPPEVPEITAPWTRRPRASGVCLLRTRRWVEVERVRLGALVVTSVRQTLLDLAASGPEIHAEVALDAAHRRGRIDLLALDRWLVPLEQRGVAGARRLRRLVGVRDPDRPIESELETLLFALLRRYGLPLPIPQYRIRTRSGWYRVDFAYPEERLALEGDGRIGHGPDRFEDDRARDNALADAGWDRRHITKRMISERPDEVAWTVGTGLGLQPVRWRPVGRR